MTVYDTDEWRRLAKAAAAERGEWKGPASWALVEYSSPARILALLDDVELRVWARAVNRDVAADAIAEAFESTGCDQFVDGFVSERPGLCENLARIAVDALHDHIGK